MKHGTITGYTHHKCRCDECRAAWRLYDREYKAGRRRSAERLPKPVPHGTLNGYQRYKCRCELCRTASAAYARKNRAAHGAQPQRVQSDECTVESCSRVPLAKNLCAMHYSRHQKTGETGPAARKIAERGEGHTTKTGYRVNRRDGQNFFEHRDVMEAHLGRPLLPTETVHHINGQRSDNSLANLELWSKSQPSGQRVVDKLAWARELIAQYRDEFDQGKLT